jgi:hypothetical protein
MKDPKKHSQASLNNFRASPYFDSRFIPDLNQMMSFSETISHLSFLRTIPAPVFNSEVNIQFMGTLINLKENSFRDLPHKNSRSVEILLECLDFNSILTCIRGLIFDYSMIIFSHETSLLFNIVEGIKQLMFPFTFDLTQYLPANQHYESDGQTQKSIFEEFGDMQPCIFAIETFDDKDDYNEYFERLGTVVVDVDASYVKVNHFEDSTEGDFPPFPNQMEFLKLLNACKNRMWSNYDKVYPERNIPHEFDKQNFITQQIRQCIFEKLQPFLIPAYKVIRTEVADPRKMPDFWSEDEYLKYIVEQEHQDGKNFIAFAKRLIIS